MSRFSSHRFASSLHGNRIVAVILLLLPLIYFWPAVAGVNLLAMGDGWSYSLLMKALCGRMLAQGTLPLWNPYLFGGSPLLAGIQPGALYPPNWLFAIFSPGVAMNIVVITTYHLSMVGMYLYARAIGATRLGALVSGAIFAFGGFMVSHLDQPNCIGSLAWAPWLLWVIEKIRERAEAAETTLETLRFSWTWVTAGAVIFAAQFFAGHPQPSLHVWLMSGAYALYTFLQCERPKAWRFAIAISALTLCGGLLCMIQLLPTRELQMLGQRAALSYEYFSTQSMTPHFLLTLIFPYFFGGGHPPLYRVGGWDSWWLVKWGFGYAGISGIALGLTALTAGKQRRMVWFWTGTLFISLFLALAPSMPFGIHRLLYHVPIYNLFRSSFWHLYEFNLAVAALAGIGCSGLARMEAENLKRALIKSLGLTSALVVITATLYRFFPHRLGAESPPPPGASALTNPEAFVPLLMFALSVASICYYARRSGRFAGALLFVVVMLDLASCGWFSHWRTVKYGELARLADPPVVKAIKERESDLNSFRVIARTEKIYTDFEAINYQNQSVVRGLQNTGGYDPLRLFRFTDIAGGMDLSGVVQETAAWGIADQGFNLLNVKYLIHERRSPLGAGGELAATYDGVDFRAIGLNLTMTPGRSLELGSEGNPATELAMVTTLANAAHFPDQTPVARVKLHTTDGRVIEHELQAGRDTSEWAYDRADVRAKVKHQRGRAVESWPQEGFEGHRYLARLPFERSGIERIELNYLRPDGELVLMRASLHDEVSGKSAPLETTVLPTKRWRKLASFGEIDLYQNLKALPRAWFVEQALALPSREVLRTIKQGKLPDGAPFDPAKTALLEEEDFGGKPIALPASGVSAGAEARVTRYEPQRIELLTRNEQAGFLILSEVYYNGWDAWVDGAPTPVERVNYTLRGIALPAGEHRVEFVFRAPSFRAGAIYSGLGALILVAGAIITTKLSKQSKSLLREV
ncbi:MAG TPA: YfhO family protein [Blastocatellia bacterium]|nr:YfhO family protein [Blastocatellia bacterium]